jgi:hypothetical protein
MASENAIHIVGTLQTCWHEPGHGPDLAFLSEGSFASVWSEHVRAARDPVKNHATDDVDGSRPGFGQPMARAKDTARCCELEIADPDGAVVTLDGGARGHVPDGSISMICCWSVSRSRT